MDFTFLGIVIEAIGHSSNAWAPIYVRLSGRRTDFNPQYLKAPSPIDVTELGIMTSVKLKHKENRLVAIDVIEEGRVTDVKDLQDPKAASPIEETELGISIVNKFVQPRNADSPM